jgi:hypothetical protein
MMYCLEIGKMKYRYLVGSFTVGIISKLSHQKYFRTIYEIRGSIEPTGISNGTADAKITGEEITAYILKHKLL